MTDRNKILFIITVIGGIMFFVGYMMAHTHTHIISDYDKEDVSYRNKKYLAYIGLVLFLVPLFFAN